MPKSVHHGSGPELAQAIAELDRFQAEFARVFELLADRLPGLYGSIDGLFGRLTSVRTAQGEGGLVETLYTALGMQVEYNLEVGSTLERGRSVLFLGRHTGEAALEWATTLDQVEKLGHRIVRRAAVGHEGAERPSIVPSPGATRELVLEARGEADRMLTTVGELEPLLGQRRTPEASAAEGTLSNLEVRLAGFVSSINDAISTADGVRAPIRQIMEHIQRQDILRQGLDHVRIVLAEADRGDVDASEASLASFRKQASELCVRLLDDLDVDIVGLADEVEMKLDRLREAGAALGRVEEASQRLDSDGVLPALQGLQARIEDLSSRTTRCGTLTDPAHRLTELVARNGRTLARVSETVSAFARQERPDDETSFRGMVSYLDSLLRSAERSARRVEITLRSLSDAIAGLNTERTLLSSLAHRVSDHTGATRSVVEQFLAELRQLREASIDIEAHVGRFDRELSCLREARLGLLRIRDVCKSILSQAERDLERLGAMEALPSEASPRLREIIERFTLFSHKSIATELDLFAPSDGPQDADLGGELTLF